MIRCEMCDKLPATLTQRTLLRWKLPLATYASVTGVASSPSLLYSRFFERFDLADILDNEERQLILGNDFHVKFINGHLHLNELTTLHQPTNMALQSLSYKIHVKYISSEDERSFPTCQTTLLSRHKISLSSAFRRGTTANQLS